MDAQYRIVVIVETPADPSELLDEAQEFASHLVETYGGVAFHGRASVEEVE